MIKYLIIRSIPMNDFNCVLDKLVENEKFDQLDVLIQDNMLKNVNEYNNVKYIPIKPGKLNFIRGILHFSFFKYKKVIIPINTIFIDEYSNLISFVLPIVSYNYIIMDINYWSTTHKNLIELWFLSSIIIIIEILYYLLLIFLLPLLFIAKIYYYIKSKLF